MRRSQQLVARVEPVIHKALINALHVLGKSQSDYIRGLIVTDLKNQGFLTDEMLARIAVE